MKNCLHFSGIKNSRLAPGMALTLCQVWLAAALITAAPESSPEGSAPADGEPASPRGCCGGRQWWWGTWASVRPRRTQGCIPIRGCC